MLKPLAFASVLIAVVAYWIPLSATAQQLADVVTVGTGTGIPGAAVDVPLYIRDVSGTSLGIDQPPGSRIQSYSIKVNYAPVGAVQSVTVTRAGITTSLTPTFESTPSSPGSITLLDTFQESTNLIPFTSNAATPGNQVGTLHFVLAASAIPSTTIVLSVDPVLTQLTDEAGSPATRETVNGGNLALVNGAIAVSQPIVVSTPTLTWWGTVLLAILLAMLGACIRRHAR